MVCTINLPPVLFWLPSRFHVPELILLIGKGLCLESSLFKNGVWCLAPTILSEPKSDPPGGCPYSFVHFIDFWLGENSIPNYSNRPHQHPLSQSYITEDGKSHLPPLPFVYLWRVTTFIRHFLPSPSILKRSLLRGVSPSFLSQCHCWSLPSCVGLTVFFSRCSYPVIWFGSWTRFIIKT